MLLTMSLRKFTRLASNHRNLQVKILALKMKKNLPEELAALYDASSEEEKEKIREKILHACMTL